ncbi:hypothetical protein DP939_04375 [Spongiactinospora rosea]|uniref:Uncharacterized protein n=1 Tax=Spongiactinospora rosea TaxID=2248750 RepID=A0A366M7V2_9ACTN|nr:hypothetical protein DP939_04375 [Spongiactinospora rosea]
MFSLWPGFRYARMRHMRLLRFLPFLPAFMLPPLLIMRVWWLAMVPLVLLGLAGIGLSLWAVHKENVAREAWEREAGYSPQPSRNTLVAMGRWLARH